MATLNQTAPTVNTAPTTGTWATWTVAERQAWLDAADAAAAEHREKPTASPYEPPTTEDECWYSGLCAGLERIACITPHGYSSGEKKAWLQGYAAGWSEAGELAEDWAEFSEWCGRLEAIHDSMRDTYEDEFNERYARNTFSWGGHDLD